MWTHRTQRFVPRPVAEVRAAIARLVATTWAPHTTVRTTEHHGTRTDWIAVARGSDDLDVALSWTLLDLDDTTSVVLTLDELEAGGDPTDGLEAVLDRLSELVLAHHG